MTSKTNGVTQYELKIGHANLVIMDTPGFGNTKGSKFDK